MANLPVIVDSCGPRMSHGQTSMSTAVNRWQTGRALSFQLASSTDGVGHGTVITSADQAVGVNVPEDDDDGALKPLPERRSWS